MNHMKKLPKILLLLCAFFIFTPKMTQAATLKINTIGTVDVSSLSLGSTLKTYTYAGGTFELAGIASPSASVSIVIDDVTKTATSDTLGAWSSLISSLTTGAHSVTVSSGVESLDFTLTIGSASASATSSSTTTSSSSTTTTLPASGSIETTILVFSMGILALGLGFLLKFKDA